mmetsp:Transcript_8609/g.8177  ORF Transcript_8609/g.8177 Transcript_8609/m.8177 type:complete len:86 (-) Transcript_8609:204-461(-)
MFRKICVGVEKMRRFDYRFVSCVDLCKKTVQAENMWETKEEWDDWINQGEKRNRWIPSDPEKVYREHGTWISWDDFFGVNSQDEN